MKFCKYCGTQLTDDAVFCGKCGKKQEEAVVRAPANEPVCTPPPVENRTSAVHCPKCGSFNVKAQVVTDTQLVDAHKGCFWWLVIGWWWVPFKWIFLTFFAVLGAIFGHKKQKLKQVHSGMWVCQDCGHTWRS